MARIMAIDYGTKRVGIAVTDTLQLIASALTTVHPNEAIKFIKEYSQKEKVETIVVGEPKRADNSPSEVEKHIVGFVRKLQKEIPYLKIVRFDERFTSKMALQAMIDGGASKKQRRNKELIDQISATIILQEYLEMLNKK
ncbi:MAG: Holliday junction resolvase RuvX [Flavobacteriales bacterium]|nr:Holliday junction resolvase RuvX [Flavobacteriales bacterium]